MLFILQQKRLTSTIMAIQQQVIKYNTLRPVSLHLAEKHFTENHLPEKHFPKRSFFRITICQKSYCQNERLFEITSARMNTCLKLHLPK